MTAAEDAAKDREGPRCLRCGRGLIGVRASRHHRKRRREPDADRVENIVILCGSGSTGCHGWAHGHPTEAKLDGWIVPPWDDPLLIPVRTPSGWVWLNTDGTKSTPQPTNEPLEGESHAS